LKEYSFLKKKYQEEMDRRKRLEDARKLREYELKRKKDRVIVPEKDYFTDNNKVHYIGDSIPPHLTSGAPPLSAIKGPQAFPSPPESSKTEEKASDD
jgi:hypothetical protein